MALTQSFAAPSHPQSARFSSLQSSLNWEVEAKFSLLGFYFVNRLCHVNNQVHSLFFLLLFNMPVKNSLSVDKLPILKLFLMFFCK